MRVVFCTVPLICLLSATTAFAVQLPQEPTLEAVKADEKTLHDVKVGSDDAALLDYFRKLTHAEPNAKRVAELIQDLGDKSFKKREAAYSELLAFGGAALPVLRQASLKAKETPNGLVERLRRLEDLVKRIEEKVNPSVQAAGARLLAARKVAKAAEVLLAFLPYAADEEVVQEICDTLTVLAEKGAKTGKADPVLLLGASDKVGIRRAAAAAALLRAGVKDQLPKLRPLLKDTDPKVRLRVALALIHAKDNEAIAPLVETLAHLTPPELIRSGAEEVLLRLAGKDAPNVALGTDPSSRKQVQAAWAAWWNKAKPQIDLAKFDWQQTHIGFTVVARQTKSRFVNGMMTPQVGQILELDRHQKVRWSFDLTTFPVDVQVLGKNRVLISEFNAMRVTERDFKGNVKWEKQVPSNPLSARRLANGHTLVVMRNLVLEYDGVGKEVFHHQRLNFDCYRAGKLPNGELVVITYQGQVQRIDPKTKQVVKSFHLGGILNSQWGSIEMLPNGHFLVGLGGLGKVAEFDQDGNKKWEANAVQPIAAQRLANGHTLVVSPNPARLVELDAHGQQVDMIDLSDNTTMVYAAQRR